MDQTYHYIVNEGMKGQCHVNGQLQAIAALPSRTETWYAQDRRLGGPHSCFGHGTNRKFSTLARIQTPDIQVYNITLLSELS
jgi:hypothetical protein